MVLLSIKYIYKHSNVRIEILELKNYEDDDETPNTINDTITPLLKPLFYLGNNDTISPYLTEIKVITSENEVNFVKKFFNFNDAYCSFMNSYEGITYLEAYIIRDECINLCKIISNKISNSDSKLYYFDVYTILSELNKPFTDQKITEDAIYILEDIKEYLTDLLSIIRSRKLKIIPDLLNIVDTYLLQKPITAEVFDMANGKLGKFKGKMVFSGVWCPTFSRNYNSYCYSDDLSAYFGQYYIFEASQIWKIESTYQKLYSKILEKAV